MSWPLSQDYNEAVQSPQSSFHDAELRSGRVAVNPLGIPLPRSGNFADVYELQCPNGSRWAVKCFTREVPGLRQRYQQVSRHLRHAQLPFTVDFTFLEQGIRVRGRWYPVLKMQWVEGLTLNEFVRQYADKPDKLEALLQIWLRMAGRLRSAGIAHGDLQHGNLLLVPGSSANLLAAKLIDYDGMFVPALAGRTSGEVGHPCYQHPQRMRERVYGPDVDRFSFLLVAAALCGLQVGGRALWDKYDSGDNLLFREADLQAPVKSPLFYELLKLGEARSRRVVEHTLEALRGDLARVPLLEQVLEPSPPAANPATMAGAAATQVLRFAPNATTHRTQRRPIIRPPRLRRPKSWLAAGVVAASALLALTIGSLVLSYPLSSPSSPPSSRADELPEETARKDRTPPRLVEESSAPLVHKPPAPAPTKPEMQPRLGQTMQNSVGMKLTYIPPGKFRMGSSDAEIEGYKKLPNRGYDQEGSWKDEVPQHEVRLTKGFYLGVFEVTQGEYEKVMGANPSEFKESKGHPVDRVTWRDGMTFCRKLSDLLEEKKAGRSYRLPTEAEWEYACRAGTTTAFHYGDFLSSKEASFNGMTPFGDAFVAKMPSLRKTVKVGSYKPNAWGLYDMHGNVWEWCLDGPRKYTSEAVDDPQGPQGNVNRPLRGGSWRDGAVRSAYRKARDGAKYRLNICGLRVLCEQKSP